ncbi:MAG TPA: hypothetical protein VKA21_01290 [Candidatus Binatia bacterium]|nr:hypothetical protein [Candidatus Binatia bacterium]
MRPSVRLALALLAALVLSSPRPGAAQPFVTFESGQVRPLALSPDTNTLYAVNTPDDRLEIFDVSTGGLVHTGSVPVGLEPVAVAARTNGEVWVVNHLSDSVSIVDVSSSPARVVRTLLVGDEPRDIVFGDTSGNRAFITCAHRGQNSGVPLADLTQEGIGRADVWVFDATNLGATMGGTPLTKIQLFGDTPRALAVSADGATVYAAVFHPGNRTTTISEGFVCTGGAGAGPCCEGGGNPPCPPGKLTFPGGLPAPNDNCANQAQPETGLIVRFNSGTNAWEDELGRSWNNAVRFSLPDEDVFAIDATADPSPVQTGLPFTGVGTVIFNMVTNPATGVVYVSNTEARNEVRFEGPGSCSTTVRGHLHEARITVLDGANVDARHLNKHIAYGTVPTPADGTKEKSLAIPLGMAVTPDGSTLYVAAFGSSQIGIFDTGDLEANTFTPNAADHITVSGGGPTGLVLRGNRLYAFTRFDNAVSVIDTGTKAELSHVPVHNPEPSSVVDGRPFLYDAVTTSSNGEASCASCHIFGDFDSLAWDLGNPDDGTLNNPNPFRSPPGPIIDPDFRPMKGPMTTQSLRGMANHGPMHWRGDRTGGNDVGGDALSEDQAFKKFNVAFGGLLGRSGPLTNAQMQAFTDFILEVTYPPNPIRSLDNSLNGPQQAGSDFFFDETSDIVQTCNGCHVLDPPNGFFGSDGKSTFENETQDFKIAHLRNLYQKVGMFGMPDTQFIDPGNNGNLGPQVRGFGFLHDGSIDTTFRFHNATVFHVGFEPSGCNKACGDAKRRNVEQFMLAFDSNLAPIVGQQVTLTGTNAGVVDARITLMLQRAGAGECDVVVKGNIGSEQRGWVSTGASFQSDKSSESTLTAAQVHALAGTGSELTYTAVPPGSGVRIGIDRDEDGCLDGDDEAPADPATCTSVSNPTKSKCTSKKFKHAGKKVRGRVKCDSQAVAQGVVTAAPCYDKPTEKFSTGWAKVEQPGNDCLTTGDEAAIETMIDDFTTDLATSLVTSTNASRCTARKLTVAGKKASARAKCHSKAAAKGIGVDQACLDKASAKFANSWSKEEQPGNDCQTTGDATTIEADVDTFVDALAGALVP